MKQSTIPGLKGHHSIISDDCRMEHFDGGAFKIAIERMKTVYMKTCENAPIGTGMKIHIVMTVEREEK